MDRIEGTWSKSSNQHTHYGNLRGRNEKQRERKNTGRNSVQKLPKSNERHKFTNQEPWQIPTTVNSKIYTVFFHVGATS